MRLWYALPLIVLLTALPGRASDPASTKERGNTSSSSSSSSSSATTSDTGPTGLGYTNLGGATTDADFGLLRQLSGQPTAKWWEVGVSFEFHRLFVQNDLEGFAVDRLFNYYSAYAQVDITRYDRVSIRAGMYEYFLSDPGETGVRADDMEFVYSRRVPLPWKLNLRITAYLTAPTSFSSNVEEGLITEPSASVLLERKFGDLYVGLRGIFHYYWTQYSTEVGGNPNVQVSWGGQATVEYDLPFFRSLTIGADIFTEWYKYYNVYPNNDSYIQQTGLTWEGGGESGINNQQPIEEWYGGEAYIRYTLPKLAGFSSDITVAYATGDPAEGYPTVLNSGTQNIFAFWRESSEFYFVVALRY